MVGYQIGMVGYQTGMVGYQMGGGFQMQVVVYQMQVMVYQMQVGSRHVMMRYKTGDDWVPGRGRVTTLMSYQSEILHSLIFSSFL